MKTSNIKASQKRIDKPASSISPWPWQGYDREADMGVERIKVMFYLDSNFTKRCGVFEEAIEVRNMRNYGDCNDEVSAIFVSKNAVLQVFENENFQGRSQIIRGTDSGSSPVGKTVTTQTWQNADAIHGSGNKYTNGPLYLQDNITSFKLTYNVPQVLKNINVKLGCCGILDQRNTPTFVQKICNSLKPGNNTCNNLRFAHCNQKVKWDNNCRGWAKSNAGITQQNLNQWCKTADGKNNTICGCWDDAGYNKFLAKLDNDCKAENVTCDLQDLRRDCVYPKCVMNKDSHDIWNATNPKSCPNTIIQNCMGDVIAGGDINAAEGIMQNCILNDAIKTNPRDGKYSKWGEWSACSVPCGGEGTQNRRRYCNNPPPANGGKPCVGPSRESRACDNGPCVIDGGYSDWGNWSMCNKLCGGGKQTRTRKCDNPVPANGGKDCVGPSTESRNCNTQECAFTTENIIVGISVLIIIVIIGVIGFSLTKKRNRTASI